MANKLCALCVAGAGALSGAAAANANLTDPFILVRASNSMGSGMLSIPLKDTMPGGGGSTTFSLSEPFDIMDGPDLIATITQLNSTVRPFMGMQPNSITLSFTFFAGGADTRFEVLSTIFTFDPLDDVAARATAGITVTDSGSDGVTATGNLAGGAHYSARYNGDPGSTFADLLVGPVSAGSGQTNTADDRSPPGSGFTPIAGGADDMSARWDFTLTAGDQVGVTSFYGIVPAPGAVVLLGVGGLFLGRRNRR
jgi:hypothetical protein